MPKANKHNVLVVAAHPDDEVLGCGGTIAKHTFNNDRVRILCMADGVTSRYYNPGNKISRKNELKKYNKEISRRKSEMLRAVKILGVKADDVRFGDFPDQRLDSIPLLDIIKFIEAYKKKYHPDIIYTHFWGDLNKDHRVTFEAVITAFRSFGKKSREKIYCFEVPESTGFGVPERENKFDPDHFVDIINTFALKIEALKIYESEKRVFPHPRSVKSIENHASKRGKGMKRRYAEAFVLFKYAK
ncbi:MAG: PIG-L family deacetylase [Candidatus Omnitrophica bacterium]|nr:PIG-L family deacetylase [Candidatus Omnitrophota bacterium]